LPSEKDFEIEFFRLNQIVKNQRLMGHEIVVVMGVGFVGSVMAGVIVDSVDLDTGNPSKFVIGMQLRLPDHSGKSIT
jgi:UDP-N-acetyl-D-glucosamine dehydrogenase